QRQGRPHQRCQCQALQRQHAVGLSRHSTAATGTRRRGRRPPAAAMRPAVVVWASAGQRLQCGDFLTTRQRMPEFSRTAPRLMVPLFLLAALGACQSGDDAAKAPAPSAATQPSKPATEPATPAHSFGPEISAEDFAQHVKTLSSDEFGGRSPGGKFEQLTINYLKTQFERLGLKPGNGDSYFQEVPAVGMQAAPDTTMSLTVDGSTEVLKQGEDMVLVSTQGKPEISVADSELVFVGYGINAPEAGWNDYDGIDVTGKTVVMLVNDPGFASQDPALFQGKRMTYYGRWTYKYEEAARQGAAAALIIHQTDAAGYGWDVVRNSWGGQEFHLPASVDPAPRLPLSGWLTAESATHLFERAGLDQIGRASCRERGDGAVVDEIVREV